MAKITSSSSIARAPSIVGADYSVGVLFFTVVSISVFLFKFLAQFLEVLDGLDYVFFVAYESCEFFFVI